MLSHTHRGRSAGTVVARGNMKVVNVRRMITSPPTSRLLSVASIPNGAISHPVVIPATISSACSSTEIAR